VRKPCFRRSLKKRGFFTPSAPRRSRESGQNGQCRQNVSRFHDFLPSLS
jgi:hypothetical protein